MKGYAQHEEGVYKDIADARAQLLAAKSPEETIAAANQQTTALGRLLAVVENYPQLKANEQFNRLMDELRAPRTASPSSACATTSACRSTTPSRRQFPANITAKMFGFKEYQFFEAPPEAKAGAQGQLREAAEAPCRFRCRGSGCSGADARPRSPGCRSARAASVTSSPISASSASTRSRSREMALHDIGDVQRTVSPLDRLAGASTLVVRARDRGAAAARPARASRAGRQLAALLEILAGDPGHGVDAEAARSRDRLVAARPPALRGAPRSPALVTAMVVAAGVGARLAAASGGRVVPGPDDPIAPNGVKRSPEAIARFMRDEVMPWARVALAPVGGRRRSRHLRDLSRQRRRRARLAHASGGGAARARAAVRRMGAVERRMDPQLRNAIYGYLAESDKQARAGYMRDVVLPGMARLLHRQPYDFTLPLPVQSRARRIRLLSLPPPRVVSENG